MPTERKKLLLRLDPAVHDALTRWASDELRSTNAQIEFLLRRALGDAGRLPGNVGQIRRPGRPPADPSAGSPPEVDVTMQSAHPEPVHPEVDHTEVDHTQFDRTQLDRTPLDTPLDRTDPGSSDHTDRTTTVTSEEP